jgi:acyl-CoA-binding protein
MFDLVGKFKYNAWKDLGVIDKHQAQRLYVQRIINLLNKAISQIPGDKS